MRITSTSKPAISFNNLKKTINEFKGKKNKNMELCMLMHFECKHDQDGLRQEPNLAFTTVWFNGPPRNALLAFSCPFTSTFNFFFFQVIKPRLPTNDDDVGGLFSSLVRYLSG